jgi:hypothetical protein
VGYYILETFAVEKLNANKMKKALVVGINQYPSAPLHGCIKDATDFSNLIETNGDLSANFNVLLKTDVQRKSTLRELIQDLFSGRNETALFYFSGHGYMNELGGYLLTPDHRKNDEGVSMNDIITLANNSSSTNKIIILDCCYSGAITAPTLSHNTIGHLNEGVTILTASKQDEVAMEVNGKGVFTNLLLEALKGGATNLSGQITPASIYAYIDQALGPWEQRPVFKTNVSKFTSLRTVTPLISLGVLKEIINYFPTPTTEYALTPAYEHTSISFTENPEVIIFKTLQKMHRAGLVEPVGEDHMYWAAMNNKTCRLTPLGQHYWRLVNEKKI